LTPQASGKWSERILHNFSSKQGDGILPSASVIFDAEGKLYGTTADGGTYGAGTVFELTPTVGGRWQEKILHAFRNGKGDSQYPFGNLVFDAAGNLYSATSYGGSGACSSVGCGTVFELTHKVRGGWKERLLHSFTSDKDGQWPSAGVTFDAMGNLYGATPQGGAFGYGMVFELRPRTGGKWKEKVLQRFNGKNGQYSNGGLVVDAFGDVYSTTAYGGAYNGGVVFEITP
jgi:uncharacterized repeat protein (TIGR03803 family)